MARRVVITGMGAITPLGNNLETTWNGVINGRSGIGHLTLFDAKTFPVRIAGEVKDFSPDVESLPSDMRLLAGRSALLGLETSKMALEDSGISLDNENLEKIGISLGGDEEYQHFRMLNEIYDQQLIHQSFSEGKDTHCRLLKTSERLAQIWSFRKRTDIGAKLLSILYNIKGPLESSHTACSSSGQPGPSASGPPRHWLA